MSTKYNDYPFAEVLARCKELTEEGHTIYQKWTCDVCGDRVTANTPNALTEVGHHEDCCGLTNIKSKGCNYMLVMRNVTLEQAADVIMRKIKDD